MKSALFKIPSRADDTDTASNLMQDAQVIFVNGIENCGWSETRRIDEDHIEVWIQTVDEVMDMLLQDPRIELVKKLQGWPEVVEPDTDVVEPSNAIIDLNNTPEAPDSYE